MIQRWLLFAAFFLVSCAEPPTWKLPDVGDSEDSGDPDTLEPDAETDVLIIGAGLAGLTAGIEAHKQGAEVLLLEREPLVGGVAPKTGGMLIFAGTPEQEAEGIVDSPEALLSEWPSITGGDTDDSWVQAFIRDQVVAVHDWLVEKDVSLYLLPVDDGASGSVHRIHSPLEAGDELVQDLLVALNPDDILTSHEALSLVIEEGVVVGARYRALSEGTEGWIRARRTIVATGSFLRDLDRIHRFRPELEEVEVLWASGIGSDGGGHSMLEELGATWDNPSAIGLYLHGIADPREGLEREEILASPATHEDLVWIGPDGRRFTDENRLNSFDAAEDALEATGGTVWSIMDQETWAGLRLHDPYLATAREEKDDSIDPALLLKTGGAFEADSVEELAGILGVDASTLTQEILDFNAYALGKAKDRFRPEGARLPHPLDSAPFYAMRMGFSVAKAFGGIEVDELGRVTNKLGTPIPGVFAAGELSGMAGGSLVGELGFTGSFSAVIYSGRIAGANAAIEALGD